jgi:hypothetical protein
MFKSSNFNPNAGGNAPKILTPGTHVCRVADIKLDAPAYKKEAYFVVVTLEGPERPEFVGLPIDKTNPSLGNYKGQIGNVRNGRYPFSDYTYNGTEILRDEQIYRWINNLAKQLNLFNAMNAGDGISAVTIEEYVDAVRNFIVKNSPFASFTFGGQEYFTEGYDKPNYRLFFPKQEGTSFPYSVLEDANGNMVNFIQFDAAKHIIVKTEEVAAPVTEFGGQTNDMFNVTLNTPSAITGFGGTNSGTISTASLIHGTVTNAIPEGLNL